MSTKNEIPKHIKDKVWEAINEGVSYSMISKNLNLSKASVCRIRKEYEIASGIQVEVKTLSQREIERRKKIGRSAVAADAVRKADLITEGFINAFETISYDAKHLIEIINHSKTEADSLKELQETILSNFEEYIDIESDSVQKATMKLDLIVAIRQSIQKINDFFTRDMIRIKAVGEMRKHLETFLKMKQEIMDVQTIKKMFDAFFESCDELDDENYIKYRNKVIELAPVTKKLFMEFESPSQSNQEEVNNSV